MTTTAEADLTISTFTSKNDNAPKPNHTTWPGLVRSLLHHRVLEHKDGALWSGARYRIGALRASENVVEVDPPAFDLDDGTDEPTVAYWLRGTEQVTVSTWSHTPEHPKLRVVIRLAEPIPRPEYDEAWRRINQHLFHGHVDPSTKDPARMFYVPSHPPGGPEPIAVHHAGEPLDWRALPPVPRPKSLPKKRKSDGDASDNRRRALALLDKWCAELADLPPNSGRHNRLLQLAHAAGGLVASGLLEQHGVVEGLYSACEANGLVDEDGHRDVQRTLSDGLEHGAASPWMPDDLPEIWMAAPRLVVRRAYGNVDGQTGEVVDETPSPNGTARDDVPETDATPTRATDGQDQPPALAAIPEYPVEALPGPMRAVMECARRDGLPAALAGGAALAAAAGATGARATFEVRPGRWVERPIVWVSDMAPRGAGKSPAQALILAPLRARDAAGWASYQDELQSWRANKEQGERPIDRSVLFSDTNLEAMVRRLASTTDGAALWDVDELSKLLRGLGEYKAGGGGDHGRFLELWSGAPWRYTRVGKAGRGNNDIDILIPAPTVSICGGLQTRLHHLLGGEEDGQRPRWLLHLAAMPELTGDRELPNDGAQQALESWTQLLERLLALRSKDRRWRMTDAARKAFFTYCDEWKHQARSGEETASTSGALEKADIYLARVCCVLAEVCEPGAGDKVNGEVNVELVNSAAAIVDFNLDCWRALPEQATLALSRRDVELDKACERLADWLEQHGGQATPRVLLRSAAGGVRTAGDLEQVLARYAAVYPGSIERTESPDPLGRGRPGRMVKAPPRSARPPRVYAGGFVSADKCPKGPPALAPLLLNSPLPVNRARRTPHPLLTKRLLTNLDFSHPGLVKQ